MERRAGMDRRQWEEDLRLRQRNFVFPDTVRNEGIFYRTLVRSKTPPRRVDRIGLVLISIPFLVGGCVSLAFSVGQFSTPEKHYINWLILILGGGASLASCLFAGLLLFRALLPASAAPPQNQTNVHKRRNQIDVSKVRRKR